ncbi:hypothetical protein GCM10023321_05470 [Pseudonocardia eucalypti]|uniref:Rhomboid family intramembrane serine protease n=1 Tax=Pseudonocardia eucalypti TaxID=648755 RepID=A0ABP9PGI1_9PSEU|nr:MFS family permease [Pseudonocardia eucalypti]
MPVTAPKPLITTPPPALLGSIRLAAVGLAMLPAGLIVQLWRHDALLGGRVARSAIPRDERAWRWPHFVANGVSMVGGTVIVPALLLTLAAVLAMRTARWRPILGATSAVLLLGVSLAAGKELLGGSAVSGPATTSLVCWGVAAWLLHPYLPTVLWRALHWLAAPAALAIGAAQLYLGHPWWAVLGSWLLGTLLLGALATAALITRPSLLPASRRSHRRESTFPAP